MKVDRDSYQKTIGGWPNILNCPPADLQDTQYLVTKICLYRHRSYRFWWVTCCYWSSVCIYLIRSHPFLGAFARRHSIVATGTGANAVLGGVGGKACWVNRLLAKKYPKVMDQFGRAACEFTGFTHQNMHSENIFNHRPWRIAAGNLFIWVVVSSIFIFTPTWGDDPIWLILFKGVETTN